MRRTVFALIVLGGALGSLPVALAQDVEQRATVLHLNQAAERTIAALTNIVG